MTYQLPPAAAIVAKHNARIAVALPILWHAVTMCRSFSARKEPKAKYWLALDVIGTAWSLIPVAQGVARRVRG